MTEPEFTKLGVACGGPSKPAPAGIKLASDGSCPHCGERHAKIADEPTSSGASTKSTSTDFERPRPAA